MNAVIFGSSGQDAYYLQSLLKQKQIQSVGVSRSPGPWVQGNITDFGFVSSLISSLRPEFIFHLAANSTTSHEALFDNHEAISTGTLNILENARLHSPCAKIFLSGSAVQFENTGDPINEQTPFSPLSPYAVSRIHATYAGRYYRKAFGLRVYTGFFFNHDSPMRSERHINQKIAATALRISKGSKEKLAIGNVNVEKEFNFAGDIIQAVWLLMSQEQVHEAVIGSGTVYSIAQWLECCFRKVGLPWQEYVTLTPGYQPEYTRLMSDPTVLKNLGWEPKVNFSQLADLMMSEAL